MNENLQKLARLVALMDHRSIVSSRAKKYKMECQRRLFDETLANINAEIKELEKQVYIY